MSESEFRRAVKNGDIIQIGHDRYMEANSVTNPLALHADANSKGRRPDSNVRTEFGHEVAETIFRAYEVLEAKETQAAKKAVPGSTRWGMFS